MKKQGEILLVKPLLERLEEWMKLRLVNLPGLNCKESKWIMNIVGGSTQHSKVWFCFYISYADPVDAKN